MITISLLILFFPLQVMSLANQSRKYDFGHEKRRKKPRIVGISGMMLFNQE